MTTALKIFIFVVKLMLCRFQMHTLSRAKAKMQCSRRTWRSPDERRQARLRAQYHQEWSVVLSWSEVPTLWPQRVRYPGTSDQLQQCQRRVWYHRHSPGPARTNPCQRRMEKHQHDSWSSRWWCWRLTRTGCSLVGRRWWRWSCRWIRLTPGQCTLCPHSSWARCWQSSLVFHPPASPSTWTRSAHFRRQPRSR